MNEEGFEGEGDVVVVVRGYKERVGECVGGVESLIEKEGRGG